MTARKQPSVAAVWRRISGWRDAAAKFRCWSRREGDTWVAHDPARGEIEIHVIEVASWRRKLARLIREARRRERAGDVAWFAWLTEYGGMIAATEIESFRQYDKAITRGGKAIKSQRAAADAGAKRRREIGERTASRVIAGDRPVSKRHARRIRTGK